MGILIVFISIFVLIILISLSLNSENSAKRTLEKAKEAARQDRKEIYERELAEYNREVERAIAFGLPIPERNLTFEFNGSDWVRTNKGKTIEDIVEEKPSLLSTEKQQEIKLTSCPACKRDLSPAAEMCPGCGHPMRKRMEIVVKEAQKEAIKGITCPTCGSTNVIKIPGTYKAASAIMWGIFSMGTLTKTFKCNKCGYRW